MRPSRDALDLLHPRRALIRAAWERVRTSVLMLLLLAIHSYVVHVDRRELHVVREALIAEKAGAEFARNLPEHVFAVSAIDCRDLRRKLLGLEDASAHLRNQCPITQGE